MGTTITQAEAARITGMTESGIRKWVLAGKLPAIKVGRIVLLNKEDVEKANELSLQDFRRQRWLKEEAIEAV